MEIKMDKPRIKKMLGVQGFLLLCGLSAPAIAADLVNGEKMYTTHCAGCHGSNGVSVTDAPSLAFGQVFTQTDFYLSEIMMSGGDRMPPYLGILNNQDVLDVITYMRSFR
jgi:cytochrome c6